MEAIKKKMQALKIEKDNAMDRAEAAENQLRDSNIRVEKSFEEVHALHKKLELIENELKVSQEELNQTNAKLEEKEKNLASAEAEMNALNRRLQQIVEDLEKSEEKTKIAIAKMEQAAGEADESERIRKMLEHRLQSDAERFKQLEAQLKEARNTADDSDRKYDSVATKLATVEDELERAEERAQTGEAKILELEEELKVVGSNVKSLEVSEEKSMQRQEEYENRIQELTQKLKEQEHRAEFAEKAVMKLQKEVDRLEDEWAHEKDKYKAITDEMDQNGYQNQAQQTASNRQMFQDGYHPQRHGMGPLSDSEFAFSNMKRMHRKRSLIGFDSGEVENVEVCALALTALSVILIIFTLPFSLFFCIKVVQEYERAVIFRLGRLVTGGARGPGIFFIVPCIDTYTKVDLRTVSFDVPPQEILSKDSVTVAVDAVVYFRISNAIASVSNVEDYARSTRLLAATTLRNVLGTKNLSEILSERESISHMIQTSLDEATDSWGVKVERVEIKDVRLPVQLQRAMAAEAEAAREARAKVIAAEGEQRASRALKEASEVITDSPAALQLRYLQTLNSIAAEKNSTIVFPVPMELFRGFIGNKHLNNRHDHSHDHHSHGYHHHHHSDNNTSGNPNNHLHHSNSVEQNLALSSNNPTVTGGGGCLRKKSSSLVMEMQNPGYSADLNPEKRQDSLEKQIDNIHVDFGLDEMMTSV